MKKPRLGPQEVVYQNRYQTIYRRQADFGEFRKEYFVTDTGQRVGVLVRGPQGILLTRQYRHLIDRLSWEVPGGKVEPGEDLAAAARRECEEETGVRCTELQELIWFNPGLDTYHNPTQVFYSREFIQIAPHVPSPEEVATCEWVPLSRCIEMIAAREIVDSLSIISLLAFKTYVAQD